MPIYEYQARHPGRACPRCRSAFEVVHQAGEAPLAHCPHCGEPVRKVISPVRVRVTAADGETARVMDRIKTYEKAGQWSHAAELADSHSAKTDNAGLKSRALDNYKKAGHDLD